jgi:hypothetical protein
LQYAAWAALWPSIFTRASLVACLISSFLKSL